MKTYYFLIFIIFILVLTGGLVFAQKPVVFPITELGNCASFKGCADFCDQEENFKACTEFSQEYGLAPPEETNKTKQVLDAIEIEAPGGCTDMVSCKNYCDSSDPKIIEECIVFADENDLFESSEEREEAMGVLRAIRQGVQPPPCSRDQCSEYCSDPAHMDECMEFGKAAGFIDEEEAEMIRRTGGRGPGGCIGKEACDVFCQENMDECMEFAMKYGLMPPEEMENAKKMMEVIKKGIKPPPCKGEKECQKYCSQSEENARACANFAVAIGEMEPEELEQAVKMMVGGKMMMEGPGGCRGAACKDYCDNPDHQEECFKFAVEHGLMDREEMERAKKMKGLMERGGPGNCRSEVECREYCDFEKHPEHRSECMEFGKRMDPTKARMLEEVMRAEDVPCGCNPSDPGFQACFHECCRNMANMRKCTEWGEKSGFMDPKQAEKNRRIMKQMKIIPPEEEMSEELRAPDEERPERFEDNYPPEGEMLCNTIEECNRMLKEALMSPPEQRPEELRELIPEPFFEAPEQVHTFEEMKNYCIENPEDEKCIMGPPEGQMFMPGTRFRPLIPSEERPFEDIPFEEKPPFLSPAFPPELEGKCANIQECEEYCRANTDDFACQTLIPLEMPIKHLEGEMPPESLEPFMREMMDEIIRPPLEGFQPDERTIKPLEGEMMPEGYRPPLEKEAIPLLPGREFVPETEEIAPLPERIIPEELEPPAVEQPSIEPTLLPEETPQSILDFFLAIMSMVF